MSLPRIISQLVFAGTKALGKGLAAAGSQAVANMKYKPEGTEERGGGTRAGSTSKAAITSQLQMSLDEAHLILNVKKDEPMEIIQRSYETIFAANSPPPETPDPKAAKAPGSTNAAATASRRQGGGKSKAPTHSLYLQSKVYRALERIKAERGDTGEGGGGAAGKEGGKDGEVVPEGVTLTTGPGAASTRTGGSETATGR